jgi:hypothetical protein
MGRFEKIAKTATVLVALLCIVCVLALCIAPYVDIPVTALKSLQIALLMMLALAGSAALMAQGLFFRLAMPASEALPGDFAAPLRPRMLPIECNCVQQC